jgi:hypothetical protein
LFICNYSNPQRTTTKNERNGCYIQHWESIQHKSRWAIPCQKTNAYAACAVEKNRMTVPTRGPKRLEGTRTSCGGKEGYIYRRNKKEKRKWSTDGIGQGKKKCRDIGREMWDTSEGGEVYAATLVGG